MRKTLSALVLLLCAVPAFAQYPPNEFATVQATVQATGSLISDNSMLFTDSVCQALARRDPRWGRKVRRDGDWSSRNGDALAYRFGDTSNKALVDIVVNSHLPGDPVVGPSTPSWQVYPGPNTGNGYWMKCYDGPSALVPDDFTRDGKSDVLWHHATRGEVWLWPMDGVVHTAESRIRTVDDTNWEIRGNGDVTGDRLPDILWRNKANGAICLWTMSGGTVVAENYVATVDPVYDIVGTGDYNGDGKADLLWRNSLNGDVWMWLMNGYTRLAEVRIAAVDLAYLVKGSGDLDGDGKADIIWCRHATAGAEVWVWLMDGYTKLAETWVGTVPDPQFDIVGVADYTGDGKADVLWRHATSGEVWLVPMDGTTRLPEVQVGTVADTNYHVVGTGDYNGDGKADILWHHATNGQVWVWLMNGSTKLAETWVSTVPDVGYQVVMTGRQ